MTGSVAVVGGTGYLGERAMAALRASELEVVSLTRRSSPRIDMSDPSTFDALGDHAVVVDLANATACSPVALAKHCVERGKVFVETTSDAAAIEDLAKALRTVEGPGSAVLGAGIFTGLSNLLARAVAREVEQPERVELVISASPFSGAGKATVDLMAAALARDAVSYENGARRDHRNVARGPRFALPSGESPTLRASFAEQLMLPSSIGAPNVEVYFAPKPSILVPLFVATPRWLGASAPYRWFMRVYFRILRGLILRGRAGHTELFARATSGDRRVEKAIVAPDGMLAGGIAIAAIVESLVKRTSAPRGLKYVDDVCELDPILARTRELGGVVELIG